MCMYGEQVCTLVNVPKLYESCFIERSKVTYEYSSEWLRGERVDRIDDIGRIQ